MADSGAKASASRGWGLARGGHQVFARPRRVTSRDAADREGILFDKTVTVESPEGRSLVSEVVPAEKMDEAIFRKSRAR